MNNATNTDPGKTNTIVGVNGKPLTDAHIRIIKKDHDNDHHAKRANFYCADCRTARK